MCLFFRVSGKLSYDQAGEETDEKVENQLSQGDLESDGMEATDEERIPLGDSDGFLTVFLAVGARNNVGRLSWMKRLRMMILPSPSRSD